MLTKRRETGSTLTIAAIALIAGTAAFASGQEFSLSIVGLPLTVDTTSGPRTITFDVIGDASVGTHMLGGSFAVESNSGFITDMSWDSAAWDQFPTDGGYAGNGNYDQVIFGQLVIPGVPPFDVPGPGSELGGVIGTFSVTIGHFTCGTIDFNLVAQDPFTLEVVDVNTGKFYRSSDGNLALNGASIFVLPTPSTLAVAGLAAVITVRRRR